MNYICSMSIILLPTDFSENAGNAVDYALKVFDDPDMEFIVLNCYDIPHMGSNTMMMSLNDVLQKDAEHEMEKEIKRLKETWGNQRMIKSVCRQGTLFDGVMKLSKGITFDLIVMGIKGMSPAEEVLIGSNTTSIISNFSEPVLAIPKDFQFAPPKHIVFATDLNSEADNAQLKKLSAFARKWDAEVVLLNVQTRSGRKLNNLETDHARRLENIFEGVDHRYHFIEDNNVIRGITSYLDTHEVDLIAMVNRQLRYVSRLFKKSFSASLAKHSKVPLLVLHE